MRVFEFESLEEAYPELLKVLLKEGSEVSPRGMLTKEIIPVSIVITNPRKRVISHPVRKLNYGFMVGELLWILRKSNCVHEISHYNKQWNVYSDNGEILNGAYGDRIFKWRGVDYGEETSTINQFLKAYDQLKDDPETRQATIVLFNPLLDYRETKDKPCTNLLRFSIRDNKLNMLTVMRSNDIWFGTPYDIFNFTMLQEIMAGMLDIEIGKYTHVVDSFHIYKEHFDKAKKLINTQYKSIYDGNINDARIDNDSLEIELSKVFEIEECSRIACNFIQLGIIEEKLNNIKNEYWRSLSAIISIYNLRKAGRQQSDLDRLKKYITNEFSNLDVIKNWKSLSNKCGYFK